MGNFESFTLELPFPKDADQASQGVLLAILGILRRGYPGTGKQRVQPHAMETYAGQLAQTMDGIYQDMLRENMEYVVRVTWDDSGVPGVRVVGKRSPKKIIVPGGQGSIIRPR